MTIAAYIEVKKAALEEALTAALPHNHHPHIALLQEACHYALVGGGKYLRPLLTMVTGEVFDVPLNKLLRTACALEMIHAYSLIHDDLPCMDDDDFRRGKPTVHKMFGDSIALLAGDALLTRAFGLIAEEEGLSPSQRIKLIQLISHSAGLSGMVGGQMIDIRSEGTSLSLTEIEQMHKLKTGALITAAVVAGGLVANGNEQELLLLKIFGEKLGLAFQILDDVLDVTSPKEKHGHTVSSDAVRGKPTYVTLFGVEEAKTLARSVYEEGLASLNTLDRNIVLLKEFTEQLIIPNLQSISV